MNNFLELRAESWLSGFCSLLLNICTACGSDSQTLRVLLESRARTILPFWRVPGTSLDYTLVYNYKLTRTLTNGVLPALEYLLLGGTLTISCSLSVLELRSWLILIRSFDSLNLDSLALSHNMTCESRTLTSIRLNPTTSISPYPNLVYVHLEFPTLVNFSPSGSRPLINIRPASSVYTGENWSSKMSSLNINNLGLSHKRTLRTLTISMIQYNLAYSLVLARSPQIVYFQPNFFP